MKSNFRSYGFWTALAGALVMLINAIGKCFGFAVEEEIVSNIVMAVAGVLVVFGVVAMPQKQEPANDKKDEKNEKTKPNEKEDENQTKE